MAFFRDEFKRCFLLSGPGGMKCPCCGPRDKNKRRARKAARHRLKMKDRASASDYDSLSDPSTPENSGVPSENSGVASEKDGEGLRDDGGDG